MGREVDFLTTIDKAKLAARPLQRRLKYARARIRSLDMRTSCGGTEEQIQYNAKNRAYHVAQIDIHLNELAELRAIIKKARSKLWKNTTSKTTYRPQYSTEVCRSGRVLPRSTRLI